MGYGMITIPTIINFYYTVIMAYSFLFLFLGFTATLPWSECSHDYNTKNCHSISQVNHPFQVLACFHKVLF
jgi:solute carrier family 6 GABA transporter-like protein 6/8/11/12/13